MNTSRLILVLSLLIFYSYSTAQTSITGTIVTENNENVEGANILLKTLENETTFAFTSTSKNGAFTLSADSGNYLLKITYIGYRTVSQEIQVGLKPLDLKSITIVEDASELEAVYLKAEAKIIQKGDTTIFNTAKFLNGTEQNLSDILQTLPGVGINDNGKVTVGGKEVDRFLIDGENLYKNQHKFGTENISSKIVGNVELIRNYTDFENLKSENESGITAINVNIKDEFKNKITGTVDAAAGIINKYEIKPSLFKFGKKAKSSLITNFNNTGESSISIRDYFEITNPMDKDNTSSGVIFSKNEEIPRFLTSREKAKSRTTNFATFSSIFNPTKNLKIDFYSIINQSQQEQQFFQEQILSTNEGPLYINNTNNTREDNLLGIAQLKSVFKKNHSVFVLNSNLNFDISNLKSRFENQTNAQAGFIFEKYKPKSLISKTNISYNERLNNGVFGTRVFFNYNSNNNKLNIDSNQSFLALAFEDERFQLFQNFQKEQVLSGIDLNYSYSKAKIAFNIRAKTAVENEQINSSTNNSLILKNDLNLNTISSVLDADITYKLNPIFSYGVDVSYNYNVKHFKEKAAEKRFTNFTTNFKAAFSPNNIGELSYSYSHQFPTIDNLLQNEIITDYRNTILNNNVAFNALLPYQEFNYQHFIFNHKKRFSLIFNASHKQFKMSINNNINNSQDLTKTEYKLINQDQNTSLLLFLEKQFKFPLAITNSISYVYSKNQYFQDDNPETFKSENIGGWIELSSKFKSSPVHFKIGYKYELNKFSFGNSKSTASKEQPYLNLNGNLTSTVFWSLDNIYKKYTIEENNKAVFYMNPSLRYAQKKSNWEYSLIGYNVLNLNNKDILESTNVPGLIEKRTTAILPGYILLAAKYKF